MTAETAIIEEDEHRIESTEDNDLCTRQNPS